MKQNLAFVITLHQFYAKHLATICKMRKSNTVIKNNLAIHNTALNID